MIESRIQNMYKNKMRRQHRASSSTINTSLLYTSLLFFTIFQYGKSLSLTPIDSINSNAAQTSSQPIQRVGIVGAGIAGLSLAHALENLGQSSNNDNNMEISVFDSRPSLNFKDGAGVQVNGGMSVLHKINPDLFASVANAALPLKSIRSRTKPWFPLSLFSGSKEDSPFATLLEFDIEEIIRKTGGETEKELIVDGTTMSYSIMRGALQQVLLDELSSDTSERVEFGKRLTGIESATNEQDGIMCQFEDGSAFGPFDLVVGCDGIQSNVKQFVEKGKIETSASKKTGSSSIYSGIRIIFAVEDGDPSLPKEDFAKSTELRQYFGNGGYGLAGTYGAGAGQSPSRSAFYIYRDPDYIGPFPKKKEQEQLSTSSIIVEDETIDSPPENADWSQNVQSSGENPQADFLAKMKQSSMPSFELIPIVENADRFFELGVYFHNPFTFSGWKREVKGSSGAFCVLAGDSARE